MHKKEVTELIEALIKPGRAKYSNHLGNLYALGYLTSLLADLAVNDSDILRKLIHKFEEQRRFKH